MTRPNVLPSFQIIMDSALVALFLCYQVIDPDTSYALEKEKGASNILKAPLYSSDH